MEIKEHWKNHPLNKQGKVELIPTDWVWKYWGRDVSPQADLMDGTLVDLDTLWKNICEEGLYEPLIIRVGIKNKKFRLESGNHRIQVFHKNGVKMIPVTVQLREECGPEATDVMTDAQHSFDFDDDVMIPKTADEYMRPSDVFASLR